VMGPSPHKLWQGPDGLKRGIPGSGPEWDQHGGVEVGGF